MTESNEKTINKTLDIEPILKTNTQADAHEPKYLGTWELFPIAISMALAVFIIGLVSFSSTISKNYANSQILGQYHRSDIDAHHLE